MATKKSVTLKVFDSSHVEGKRFELDEAGREVRIYDETKVQLKEILPYLIKPKRAYRNFCKKPA